MRGRPARRERLVFISPSDPPEDWRAAFAEAAPEIDFTVSRGDVVEPETIDWAVVWKPPHGALGKLPNLKAVLSMGAGVDHLIEDPDFPRHLPLSRVVDPYLTAGMREYVALHVLAHHRGLFTSAAEQRAGRWTPFTARRADETRVGIMGLGVLGQAAATALGAFGYALSAWSRTAKDAPGIACFAGMAALPRFLSDLDIVVCLLPLTADTRGILNGDTLALLPKGAALINAARGAHVVEAELIAALDSGQLSGATLDVFAEEPLPAQSPLWRHPRVQITPHIASLTDARSTARDMADSIRRVRAGLPPLNPVDVARGY